jgi:hypothetical protein
MLGLQAEPPVPSDRTSAMWTRLLSINSFYSSCAELWKLYRNQLERKGLLLTSPKKCFI